VIPLLFVVALLAYGFWPRPPLVEAVRVAPAPLTVTIEEEGKTRVIDRYEITAPVSGVANRLAWDVGDTVGHDQVLLSIKPLTSEVLDPRREAEARARAARRSAEFTVEVARYDLEAARTTLQYAGKTTTENSEEKVLVRAPVSGLVLAIQHIGEGPVKVGQPLLEIGDTRALEVEVEVLSEDAVRIRPGMRVLFERWGSGRCLPSRPGVL